MSSCQGNVFLINIKSFAKLKKGGEILEGFIFGQNICKVTVIVQIKTFKIFFGGLPDLATLSFLKFFIQISFKLHCSNFPSSIQRESNPQPLDLESSALTTRPWLLAIKEFFKCNKAGKYFNAIFYFSQTIYYHLRLFVLLLSCHKVFFSISFLIFSQTSYNLAKEGNPFSLSVTFSDFGSFSDCAWLHNNQSVAGVQGSYG